VHETVRSSVVAAAVLAAIFCGAVMAHAACWHAWRRRRSRARATWGTSQAPNTTARRKPSIAAMPRIASPAFRRVQHLPCCGCRTSAAASPSNCKTTGGQICCSFTAKIKITSKRFFPVAAEDATAELPLDVINEQITVFLKATVSRNSPSRRARRPPRSLVPARLPANS
jgi:hypothetical protein